MTATKVERPQFTGFHHYSPVVSDVDVSAAWYERVLGLSCVSAPCPEADAPGGVLLSDPESGVAIQLGVSSGDRRSGHPAFSVSSRSQLDTWAAWLDGLGVAHDGVVDIAEPEPYAYLVFRDPDDVPLVLVHATG